MIYLASPHGVTSVPGWAVEEAFQRVEAKHHFPEPLMRPASRDELDVICMISPLAPMPMRHLRLFTRPMVLLIGDDPGNPAGHGGPAAWRCADRIGAWCKGAIVHAAGGDPAHYEEAARGACMVGKLVMVETTSAFAMEWAACINCPTTLMVLTRTGPHPLDDRVLH